MEMGSSAPVCDPVCAPVCDPVCAPACDPVCAPACDPVCAPACDPVCAPACDPRTTRSPERDASVIRGAEGPEAETQSGDVKRRSSVIRCPYCRFRCRAAFSFQIHVGSQHPVLCEDVSVGRLGKAVFYQRTAKLFHCHICFFTSKDYTVVLEHLLVRHCCVHTAEGRGDEVSRVETQHRHTEGREQEMKPEQDLTEPEEHSSSVESLMNGEDEGGDVVNMSDSRLQHRLGVYQCPYCRLQCSLSDLHQHLSECRALEQNRDRGETGTAEEEEE